MRPFLARTLGLTMFRAYLHKVRKLQRRFTRKSNLRRGLTLLHTTFGSNIEPAMLCKFVHEHSWHNVFEASVQGNANLKEAAFRLADARERYRNVFREVTGSSMPSSSPHKIWGRIIDASISKDKIRYLECGHRSIAVASMAAFLKIPCRYITLFSAWHPTMLMSHTAVELRGKNGWEFHDPDYGYCVHVNGKPVSLLETIARPLTVSCVEYSGKNLGAPYIKNLFDHGYFASASFASEDGADTLYMTDSQIAHKLFRFRDRELAFVDYWMAYLSHGSKKQVVWL